LAFRLSTGVEVAVGIGVSVGGMGLGVRVSVGGGVAEKVSAGINSSGAETGPGAEVEALS